MDDTRRFLTQLFRHVEGDYWFYLWTLSDKRSHWFQFVSDAVQFAADRGDEDVYVGVGISRHPRGDHERIKNDDADGIIAFVADIDYFSEKAHKRATRMPENQGQAVAILREAPVRPTIITHTGHGNHGWWVLEEPWIFDDAAEREQAYKESRRWGLTLKNVATTMGYDIDSMHDLARVMRVPGTMNTKDPDNHVACSIIEMDEANTPDISELREYLADEPVEMPTSVIGEGLYLDPNAEAPPEWIKIMANDDYALGVWNEEVRLADSSPSGYDLALANIAARAGMPVQHIADLMIARRRHKGHDPKLRLDYYQNTIAKAVVAANRYLEEDESRRAVDDLYYMQRIESQNGVEADSPEEAAEKVTADRAKKIELVSKAFNADLHGLYQIGADPPTYVIELNDQTRFIEGAKLFNNQRVMSDLIVECGGPPLRAWSKAEWRTISTAMTELVIKMHTPEESSESGLVNVWLREFLDSVGVGDGSRAGDLDGSAILYNEAIHIHGPAFTQYVYVNYGKRPDIQRLTVMLVHLGATKEDVNIEWPKPVNRSLWKLPPEKFPTESYVKARV